MDRKLDKGLYVTNHLLLICTFLLNVIDLLPESPVYVNGEAALLYDVCSQAEVAASSYSRRRYRHQVTYYYIDPAEEDSSDHILGHTHMRPVNHMLFVFYMGEKQMLHNVLSNGSTNMTTLTPFPQDCY